jgi:hypothetical protein
MSWGKRVALYVMVASTFFGSALLSVATWSGAVSSGQSLGPAALETIGYGRIGLSVPRTWSIRYEADCPGLHGTVMIGTGRVVGGCAAYNAARGIVWVLPLPPSSVSLDIHAPMKEVNGLRVYEPIPIDSNFHTMVDIPKFGIRIMVVGLYSAEILRSIRVLKA